MKLSHITPRMPEISQYKQESESMGDRSATQLKWLYQELQIEILVLGKNAQILLVALIFFFLRNSKLSDGTSFWNARFERFSCNMLVMISLWTVLFLCFKDTSAKSLLGYFDCTEMVKQQWKWNMLYFSKKLCWKKESSRIIKLSTMPLWMNM